MPKPNQDANDDARKGADEILEDALDNPEQAELSEEEEGKGQEGAEEPEGSEDIPEHKRKQYNSVEQALRGVLHWEKTASKHAEQSREKDDVIKALEAQIAALRNDIKGVSKKGETKDDVDDQNPLDDIIDKRAEAIARKLLEPIVNTDAQRKAKDYDSKMSETYGESWEGFQPLRDNLRDQWKSGDMLEPELWQLAAIGRLFIDRNVSADRQTPMPRSSSPDFRSSTRVDESDINPDAAKKSRGDALEDALDRLVKRPMGVSPVR